MRHSFLLVMLSVSIFAASTLSGAPRRQGPLTPDSVPSGAVLYSQACASCHGDDAKGHGPNVAHLKTPPPDLTTLAKRHGGKFPYDYVSTVLLVGVHLPEHGSSDMPVWGPLFRYVDKDNKRLVLQRIDNISNYLASLQQK